jgi:hypothetical protein
VLIDVPRPQPAVRRRPAVRAAAGGAGALLIGVMAGVLDGHYRFFDMVIYHDAIRWWIGGGDLYEYAAPVPERLGFTYPPVAAFLLLPVAAVPAVKAGWLNAAGSVVVLAIVLPALITTAATRPGWSGWCGRVAPAAALPLALCTEPVRQTLGLGQVNLLLFALMVADLVVLRRTGSRWAGAGVGIAAAVKITPGLFLVFLLISGQWRTARTAAATAAALTGAGFVLAPAESLHYFGDLLWQTQRVGPADAVANQSLAGLLARLGDSTTAPAGWWIVLVLLALTVGLSRARRAHLDGDEVTALTLVGLTANLVSPISWTHHLMFLPVAVLILADLAVNHRTARHGVAALTVYAVSVVSPIWLVPDHLTGLPALAGENAFTLLLLALVCALPWRPVSATGARYAGPGAGSIPQPGNFAGPPPARRTRGPGATGRQHIVKFHGHYHGWTGALGVGANFDVSPGLAPPPTAANSGGAEAGAGAATHVVPWNDAGAVRAVDETVAAARSAFAAVA